MFAHTFAQRTPTKIQMLYGLMGVNALSNLSCFKARSIFSIFMANFFWNYFTLFPNNSNIHLYVEGIQQKGKYLSANGEILIYACEIASGKEGREFVR